MTIDQYNKWAKEIKERRDTIISTQQFMRMCNVYIQDMWLDTQPGFEGKSIRHKTEIMFELQGHFVK